jgi:hypothetical protein
MDAYGVCLFGPMKPLLVIVFCALPVRAQVPVSNAFYPAVQLGPVAQQNPDKAQALVEQMIQALGGPAYLNLQDVSQQGRAYSFFRGEATSTGIPFWRFVKFPDKERIELTKHRDVVNIFTADKGYEITYKGTAALDPKQLSDYLRRREHSLEWVLRQWLKQPGVVLLYEGTAVAADKPADKVSVLNAKNDSVTFYIDSSTHLPIKKTYSWRDPTDQLLNTEDEVYDAYRLTEGIMTPYSITRFYNGETSAQRFLSTVNYNQNLNDSMFDAKLPSPPPKK